MKLSRTAVESILLSNFGSKVMTIFKGYSEKRGETLKFNVYTGAYKDALCYGEVKYSLETENEEVDKQCTMDEFVELLNNEIDVLEEV